MKYIAVVTTVGNLGEAQSIACALVGRRLAACAQISEIESFYTWQGCVQNEKEFRLLFKTTDERYPAVEAAIKELHPYELPPVVPLHLNTSMFPMPHRSRATLQARRNRELRFGAARALLLVLLRVPPPIGRGQVLFIFGGAG